MLQMNDLFIAITNMRKHHIAHLVSFQACRDWPGHLLAVPCDARAPSAERGLSAATLLIEAEERTALAWGATTAGIASR